MEMMLTPEQVAVHAAFDVVVGGGGCGSVELHACGCFFVQSAVVGSVVVVVESVGNDREGIVMQALFPPFVV